MSVWVGEWVGGVFLCVPPTPCHLPPAWLLMDGGVDCETSSLPELEKVGKSHFKGEHGGGVGFCQL